MIQIGVTPTTQEHEQGLMVLAALPLSFTGLAAFRAWMWVVTDLSSETPGAEQIHDCLLCGVLLGLAAIARHLVPLGKNRIAQIACGIMALIGSSLIAATIMCPAMPPVVHYLAIACIAIASALLILSWCELYACLDVARIALCIALIFPIEQAIIFILSGLSTSYRVGALFFLPALALVLLQRAYCYLPSSMRPRPVTGKVRVPWKLILLLSLYYLVSGARQALAGDQSNPAGSVATLLASAFLLIAIVFFSERFDLALAYRTPIALFVCALLLLPASGSPGSIFFSFCLSLSTRLFEVVIFLLLADICRRHAIMAVILFGIEESTTIFSSIGYAIGASLRASPELQLSETMAMVAGIALLLAATLLLFNDKKFESTWESPLIGPGKIRWDREQREALASACDRVAATYGLTNREREVLALLGEGKSLSRVCQELCIAKGTAKAHTDHIYTKIGIHNRRELLDILSCE